MKKWLILFIILFVAPLLTLGIMSIIIEDETVSIIEKRELAYMPSFSFDKWYDGSFSMEFEEYYTDTFPIRDKLLNINQQLPYFYNFTLNNEESIVVIPFDEMALEVINEETAKPTLIVTNSPKSTKLSSSSDVTKIDITPTSTPSPSPTISYPEKGEETYAGSSIIIVGNRGMQIVHSNESAIQKYANTLSEIATALDTADLYSIIIPTSGEFYSPEYYHTDDSSQKDMLDLCYAQMENVIPASPYSTLYDHSDEYIFFNTDHHWSALGAYYAYEYFCSLAGNECPDIDEYESGTYERFVGSLYGYTKQYPQSKKFLDNPDSLTYYLPIANTQAKRYLNSRLEKGIDMDVINTSFSEKYSNKYLCFLGGDHSLVEIDTSIDNGKSCLLIKDSYGNAFAPFLTSSYEKVFIVDPRRFNCEEFPAKFQIDEFVLENNIDDVIILNNTYNINAHSYSRILGRMLR